MYIRSSIHYIYACMHQCTSDHPYITYMHAFINVRSDHKHASMYLHLYITYKHASMYFRSSIHYI